MTLRFDWYPRFDHSVINLKTDLVLDLVTSKGTHRKTREETERTTKQILSSLYYAYFSFPKGSSEVSLPLTSNHYSKSRYSYRIVRSVFDFLSDLRWIESQKGTEAGKKVTRIWATGELSLAFDGIGLVWSHQEAKPRGDLVELRNSRNPEGKTKRERGPKVNLEVPENDEVATYKDNLFNFNQFLLKHCISLDLDDENLNALAEEMVKRGKDKTRVWSSEEEEKVGCLDFSRVQLRRIFSRGSLQKGGRFYGGWWQSIPSLYRPHIRINGKKTTEMDFSSMALRIVYAMEGMDVSKDEDLYDIGLPNWEVQRDPRRKPIKTFINAIMNDETGNFKLPSEAQKLTGVDHKTLHKLVLKRHEKIAHHFSTGIGLITQFMDSRIAEEVMLKMMHEDVLVLPIHDSFIVRSGFANWLNEEMENAFRRFVRATVGITVEGTKGNEHFGLPMEKVESRVVPLGSEEAWDAFESKNSTTMGRYLGSWVFLGTEN